MHATSPDESAEISDSGEERTSTRDILVALLALAGGALVTLAWLFALVWLGRLVISAIF